MSAIADLLQEKVGLSAEQAQQAEQVVLQYVSSKVPSEFQGLLGPILGASGGGGSADGQPAAESGGLSSLLGAASSLFGGNKG